MAEAVRLLVDRVDSPLGPMALHADEAGRLHALRWIEEHDGIDAHAGLAEAAPDPRRGAAHPASDPGGLSSALRAYFAGELGAIDALEVALGGTPFQRSVWAALRQIPCGQTWSYGELARHIGQPAAVRAVGLANGQNPVAVVVPCHRVIGADGRLTGYGGGLHRKRWLLAHERPPAPLFAPR